MTTSLCSSPVLRPVSLACQDFLKYGHKGKGGGGGGGGTLTKVIGEG